MDTGALEEAQVSSNRQGTSVNDSEDKGHSGMEVLKLGRPS